MAGGVGRCVGSRIQAGQGLASKRDPQGSMPNEIEQENAEDRFAQQQNDAALLLAEGAASDGKTKRDPQDEEELMEEEQAELIAEAAWGPLAAVE